MSRGGCEVFALALNQESVSQRSTKTARVHDAARRRGGRVAAIGTRAAAGETAAQA